jgi:hypothetical protein
MREKVYRKTGYLKFYISATEICGDSIYAGKTAPRQEPPIRTGGAA